MFWEVQLKFSNSNCSQWFMDSFLKVSHRGKRRPVCLTLEQTESWADVGLGLVVTMWDTVSDIEELGNESQLCFQFQLPVDEHPGRQCPMAHVPTTLPPRWDTWVEFLGLGLNLLSTLRLCRYLGSEPAFGTALSLLLCYSDKNKYSLLFKKKTDIQSAGTEFRIPLSWVVDIFFFSAFGFVILLIWTWKM